MAVVVADIFGRKVLNKPVPMSYEVDAFMLVFTVLMGLAYSQRQRAHTRVKILTLRMPPRLRAIVDLVASTLGIAIYGAVFYQTFKWSYHSFEIGKGLINIPKWPSQFALAFGALLISLQFMSDWIYRAIDVVVLFRESKTAKVPEREDLPGDAAIEPAISD